METYKCISSYDCREEEEGENHLDVPAKQVATSLHGQSSPKLELYDDSSFLQVSQEYSSSSSSSSCSFDEPFEAIHIPSKKIKISDFLESMRQK